ncbi:hypothetical protein PVAP13_3NG122140 [Panicum virgatum]|uniref:Uncharacterized protein n=1 Tax=Panicum virgatum TaxID=38727 RepID=A0A8T0U1C6_PANVG|nr:hypothetical protein PVAP13_3NG122140 [Panicum virgatum]
MLYVKLPYCCARARQLVSHKTHRACGRRQSHSHASSLQANNAITAASISSDFISFPGPAGSNSPSFATAEEQSAEKELEESFGTNKNKQVMTATMLIQMRTATL